MFITVSAKIAVFRLFLVSYHVPKFWTVANKTLVQHRTSANAREIFLRTYNDDLNSDESNDDELHTMRRGLSHAKSDKSNVLWKSLPLSKVLEALIASETTVSTAVDLPDIRDLLLQRM